jgi:hypothetical protein
MNDYSNVSPSEIFSASVRPVQAQDGHIPTFSCVVRNYVATLIFNRRTNHILPVNNL